jgi:hypothetical protein
MAKKILLKQDEIICCVHKTHLRCKDTHRCKVKEWWLMCIILATQEVEIRKTMVQSQFQQKVQETSSKPMAGHSGRCLSS